ncbi:MAG: DinB family protein, partial [Phycisphaerales bacterium]
ISPEWEALFKAGVACHDDPDGTIYPSFEAVKAHYFRATDAAIEKLGTIGDDVLIREPAEERLRSRFPTVGSMLNFLLIGHTSMHMGQLSTWRRCMGLGSVE